MEKQLKIRSLTDSDCEQIYSAFREQGWEKPISLYQSYLDFQTSGKRDILVAELEGDFAGYLTILWESEYGPFKEKGIPEINDFNVLEKFQRRGIGSRLMDEAESRIKQRSPFAGIGFGVTKDYGKAQILYIKRGYVPDGNGMVRNHLPLNYGEQVTVDDDLAIYLTKKL